MTSELKSCPFCGGENFVRSVNGGIYPAHVDYDHERPYVTTCELYCENCLAEVSGYAASADLNEDLYYQAIANCYEKWNTRAERTCEVVYDEHGGPDCGECGCVLYSTSGYCPNCGVKLVE